MNCFNVFVDPYNNKKKEKKKKLEWNTDAVDRDAALQNIECISYDFSIFFVIHYVMLLHAFKNAFIIHSIKG